MRGRYALVGMTGRGGSQVDVVVMNHDRDVLDAMRSVVEAEGFTVATRQACEPVEALAAFVRERDPRVVVYDLGPPPVEGALAKWRDLCRQPGADRPYVVTSTFRCELDPHPCMVECVLLKPLTMGDMTAAVRRAMQR